MISPHILSSPTISRPRQVLARRSPLDAGCLVWMSPLGMMMMLLAVRPTDTRAVLELCLLVLGITVGFLILLLQQLVATAQVIASDCF